MDLKLRGKVAVVTGGAGGIGSGICKVFAEEGANLVITYVAHPEPAEELAASLATKYGVQALAMRCDSGEESDAIDLFQRVESELGGANILVNNAGNTFVTMPFVDIDLATWEAQLHDNLTGQFLMSREFARAAIAAGRPGRIVNVASKAAVSSVTPHRSTYVANKAGEVGLTRAMAVDLLPHGITVNAVLPGLVMNRKIAAEKVNNPAAYQHRIDRSPLGRIGEPEEMGRVVALLASEMCPLTVGSIVDATGGLLT